MRKLIEWLRVNADGSIEVHFVNADNHPTGFTITTNDVTWRVVNNPESGHMFIKET
jgi:hypothetical protein